MTKLSWPIATYIENGLRLRRVAGLVVVTVPMRFSPYRPQSRDRAIAFAHGEGHHVCDLRIRWWLGELVWVFAWVDRPTGATWVCQGHDARWRACMEVES